MKRDMNTPRNPEPPKPGEPLFASPDVLRGREGDDSSSNDIHADEQVIVNEQRGNKTVNGPSQTAANTSETNSSDEEITDEVQDSDE